MYFPSYEPVNVSLIYRIWNCLPDWVQHMKHEIDRANPLEADGFSLGLLMTACPFAFTRISAGPINETKYRHYMTTVGSIAGWKLIHAFLDQRGLGDLPVKMQKLDHEALKGLGFYLGKNEGLLDVWEQAKPVGPMWQKKSAPSEVFPFKAGCPNNPKCSRGQLGSERSFPGDDACALESHQLVTSTFQAQETPGWVWDLQKKLRDLDSIILQDTFVAALAFTVMPSAITRIRGPIFWTEKQHTYLTTLGSWVGWSVIRKTLQAIDREAYFESMVKISPQALKQVACRILSHSEFQDLAASLSPEASPWTELKVLEPVIAEPSVA